MKNREIYALVVAAFIGWAIAQAGAPAHVTASDAIGKEDIRDVTRALQEINSTLRDCQSR